MTQTISALIKGIAVASVLISIPIVAKYKPAYAITINDQIVGYVESKEEFQEQIEKNILSVQDDNVAFVNLDTVNYSCELISRDLINEAETLNEVKKYAKNVYKVYEVKKSEAEDSIYVNTLTDAEELVAEIKDQYQKIEPDIKISELYLEEEPTEDTIQTAKEKVEEELNLELEEKLKEEKTVNGVYIASVPLNTGYISSRFGSRESIRDHVHQGLDIAASYGSSIKAVADGTVKFASFNSGGYGNLVVIDHGNGVETYYGHCSQLYVSKGDYVSAGDVIAAVGSTGNSTGNHLHFELRLNGVQVNPEEYIN